MSRISEGTVIADKYRIERPLARGGMGSIWVARHLQLDMQVAVKFMDAAFAASAEGRSRFEREAKAVALIQSPNIIHIHDYGIHDNTPYMAMELLRGEDLGAKIRREGRLPVAFVADVLVQVCKALRKAHEAGIVHRDLKPANIYLARDDDEQIVKVLDFGVAKMLGMGEAGESTRTGVVVGSVHYMSPEQARGMKSIDHRADLWSLGVIAFRALTGQLPFAGDQMGDVIVKICTDPLPDVSRIRPDLGPGADGFFARAFARNPDERFPTAREFARAFVAAFSGAELSTSGVPTAGLLGGPMRAITLTGESAMPASSATPPGMSLGTDPSATPPVAPIYPPPPAPISNTLTGSSQVSAAGPRPASKKAFVLLGAVCATALAIGGLLAFTRTPPQPAPPAAAPPPETSAAATATVTATASATAAVTASATVTATASAAAAPAKSAPPAEASSARKAPVGPQKKINSELGF
jgi:serine/threonine-protein kinase